MRDRYVVRNGKIESLALEINVVEHCNLACRSCSHLSPVVRPALVDNEQLERDLHILAKHYHVGQVRLLGGEPLLHRDLRSVIDIVRASGVTDRISITTNGVLLDRAPDTVWEAVDDIWISEYPGFEFDEDTRSAFVSKARTFGVRLRLRSYDSFRESYSELGTDDDPLVQKIFDRCIVVHVGRCHAVAGGYFFKCAPSYFISKVLHPDESVPPDGLEIADGDDFGSRLLAFLTSRTPLPACRNCLGTSGREIPHQQVRRSEFRAVQRRPTEEMIDPRKLGAINDIRQRLRIRTRLGLRKQDAFFEPGS